MINLDQDVLDAKGFTLSGKQQFSSTVHDYTDHLLERSLQYGNVDKADGLPVEVTHDHVRASAQSLTTADSRMAPSKWLIAAHVSEYLSTAAAGVGGGHLDEQWGIITFGLGISAAVLLVVIRLTKGKEA
ncbi:hypothetical protein DSM3645_01405 [Blastopirellula marina DSM 3645]|uniref:Uncharacterized protein n=1 Tax=Blastopirellula marina DSM 3645 TaxID=314230 RepID=A3ZN00_9BACT|nr:hypothetical protein DSM3645_01405 [Blastopirellula marina DSM 3645]